MALNLLECDKACLGCVKEYKDKHNIKPGQKFKIRCEGIPKEHIPLPILESIEPEQREFAKSMVDPVTWAAQNLDWHCLDPHGEVWKRKNPDEYYKWIEEHPGEDIYGHSRYHRPYQAEMLRCTSKRKVFRIGRQAGKTETLVISMLFSLFTKPGVPEDEGFKIIVITPYQAQIDLIFGRMNQLIDSSPLTSNSRKRNVKAPTYTLELHNKSIVRGFTAGTRSGGDAASVRGQTGNMLVFDEADYLSAGDIDAALAIITNYPNATVWMSSTPSGKRERFYEACNSKLYKQFHYPSWVNPLWNDDLEATFREQLTELGYVHEVGADFGEQEQGVFQHQYVQAAKKDYKYGDLAAEASWTYTIGVDWNDTKNGTTINVLGFNPRENLFYVVDRHVVSRDGWTQTAAMIKIRDLNRIWRPIAIYVDKGFGSTQVEVLHKEGHDARMDPKRGPRHPDSRLSQVIKAYDFGSTIETRDLFTKAPLKKHAKGFLVESTVRRFESNDIRFPEEDSALEDQLLGYIIDRVTPSGNPVYKAGNEQAGDHALDALMLSVVAFILQVTPFGKPKYDTSIAFSGQFGERLDTPQEPGTLSFMNPKKRLKDQKETKERMVPDSNRATWEQKSLFKNTNELPGAHIHRGKQPKLINEDGLVNRNVSANPIRTVGRVGGSQRSFGFRRPGGNRPKRKNI